MSPILKKLLDKVNHMAERKTVDVLEVLHTVKHLLRSRELQVLRETAPGVSHMDARVLGFFNRRPGETLSALVAHSGRDKGQMARLVGSLRERGLLNGQVDEHDRRNLRLYLTPQGQQLADTLHTYKQQLSRQAIQGFTAAEESQLGALLTRLLQNLETPENRGEPQPGA